MPLWKVILYPISHQGSMTMGYIVKKETKRIEFIEVGNKGFLNQMNTMCLESVIS